MLRSRPRPPGGVVVITGASSGMGEDAALYLNELGYTVAAGIRKPADGERLRAAAARPEALQPIELEVTDADRIARAREAVERLLGPGEGLRGLFSNAGIAAYDGDVSCEGCPLETQQRVMDVNFFGAVRVVQAFLPLLRAGHGTVVFNSALMAHTVVPFNGGYAASKAALEAWADALRRELRPHGVGVAILRAGAINTGLGAKQHPEAVPDSRVYPVERPLVAYFMREQAEHGDDPRCAPRRMSELVADALAMGGRPAPRRIVGGGARAIWTIGCLPDRVQDALFARLLKHIERRARARG